MIGDKQENRSTNKPEAKTKSASRGPLGCLLAPILAPFRLVGRQFKFILVVFALSFGSCAACALFLPAGFKLVVDTVRSAGLRTYVVIIRAVGSPARRIITYDGTISAYGRATRDLGLLSAIYGEGAEVFGTMRVSLGADLLNNQFGVLGCDIYTETLRDSIGRAPFAGTAFDASEIKQAAFNVMKGEAARQAIERYWPQARADLQRQFASWALGLEIPEKPTLLTCPAEGATPSK